MSADIDFSTLPLRARLLTAFDLTVASQGVVACLNSGSSCSYFPSGFRVGPVDDLADRLPRRFHNWSVCPFERRAWRRRRPHQAFHLQSHQLGKRFWPPDQNNKTTCGNRTTARECGCHASKKLNYEKHHNARPCPRTGNYSLSRPAAGGPPNGGPPGGRRPPQLPIITALDTNHDGIIDSNEIANASAELLTLDKNGDGKLTADEYLPAQMANAPKGDSQPPLPAIVKALDANGDGVIDADEIANAPAALKTLDKNGDGKLTMDELMGHPPGGFGEPPPDGPN